MSAFDDKAAGVVARLISYFYLADFQAAGIVGNLGHESGLEAIQEKHPVSGRGGFGWAQWTGPRRVDFEQYCSRNNYRVTDDEANYKWLWLDLTGAYALSIAAVKATKTLEDATLAFERTYEKAGVINLASRVAFAKRALYLYKKVSPMTATTTAASAVVPADTKKWYQIKTVISGLFTTIISLAGPFIPFLSHVNPDAATQLYLDLFAMLTGVGGVGAIIGRLVATHSVGGAVATLGSTVLSGNAGSVLAEAEAILSDVRNLVSAVPASSSSASVPSEIGNTLSEIQSGIETLTSLFAPAATNAVK